MRACVRARFGVGAGAWVVEEAAKNDKRERIVGATVIAAFEPVLVGAFAAAGIGAAPQTCAKAASDWIRFGVAGTGEHLAGDLGSNARKGRARPERPGEPMIKLMVSFGDFL